MVSGAHKGGAEKAIFQLAKNCFFATAIQTKPQPFAASSEREIDREREKAKLSRGKGPVAQGVSLQA